MEDTKREMGIGNGRKGVKKENEKKRKRERREKERRLSTVAYLQILAPLQKTTRGPPPLAKFFAKLSVVFLPTGSGAEPRPLKLFL